MANVLPVENTIYGIADVWKTCRKVQSKHTSYTIFGCAITCSRGLRDDSVTQDCCGRVSRAVIPFLDQQVVQLQKEERYGMFLSFAGYFLRRLDHGTVT